MKIRVFYLSKRIFGIFPQWKASFERMNNFKNLHLITVGAVFYAAVLLVISKLRKPGSWLNHGQWNLLFALTLTTPAALISSWSWFPALGHMSHHYHMNGIMYVIPFGLTAFLLFSVLVEYSIQLLLQTRE